MLSVGNCCYTRAFYSKVNIHNFCLQPFKVLKVRVTFSVGSCCFTRVFKRMSSLSDVSVSSHCYIGCLDISPKISVGSPCINNIFERQCIFHIFLFEVAVMYTTRFEREIFPSFLFLLDMYVTSLSFSKKLAIF